MTESATLRIREGPTARWLRVGIVIITLCVLGIGVHAVWSIIEASIDSGKRLGYLGIALGTVAYYFWFEWLMWWPDLHRDWRIRIDEHGFVIDAPDLFPNPEVLSWPQIRAFLADSPPDATPVRTLWAQSNWGRELAVLPIGPTGNLLLLATDAFTLERSRLRTRLYCGSEVRGILADVENSEEAARLLRSYGIPQLDALEKPALKKTRRENLRGWKLFPIIVPALAGLFGIAMILGELD